MKINLPQQALTRKVSQVQPMSVVCFQREMLIVTGSVDPADESFDMHPGEEKDIICLNIRTGKIETLNGGLDVELMDAELDVRNTILVLTTIVHDRDVTVEEEDEIRAGRLLPAIKLVRSRTGLGLKDAKDIVDSYKNRMGL